ncbi:hypothetical protein COLO4_00792 [Corchorus olitorius]|uniref:Uncharacterized protein n=1 Tax=Corchorus olitorius TaxID=93759 RepID=A0A1R3L3K0_9ROSI|nr:hypothetical protein COLO4_00792 [Corchorus olitorius]
MASDPRKRKNRLARSCTLTNSRSNRSKSDSQPSSNNGSGRNQWIHDKFLAPK